MTTWPDQVVQRSTDALTALADPDRAPQMAAYMKDVAPFLGVMAGPRRAALRAAWRDLAAPTSDELGRAATLLSLQQFREVHYASFDLLDRYLRHADDRFARRYLTTLLTTTPWWDNVDGLVSAAVSPLCRRGGLDDLVDEWSRSGDRWLVRAALGHQRGWKGDTDVDRVLGLCHDHWPDREFFVAKAVGWALRDLAALDPDAVASFLDEHPERNTVATREALRGVDRARRRATG
jgi:3-methyladenine DNA glycosylase AlkD